MPLTIRLSHKLPDEEADRLAGQFVDDSAYDTLITESTDVFKPDGSPLLHFRKGSLSLEACQAGWKNLRRAAAAGSGANRGLAGGLAMNREGNLNIAASRARSVKLKQDGTVSNTSYGHNMGIASGIIGYWSREARRPFCRMTAFNLRHQAKFKRALPMILEINELFKTIAPDRFKAQYELIEKTSKDFFIEGTAFTTITVNRNFRTAVHKDVGDFKDGFGVMCALEAGEYRGGYLVFPAYRVAVDMRTTDLLLADVHEWHGNTRMIGRSYPYERISLVLYYREKIKECGTAEEELHRAKARPAGKYGVRHKVVDGKMVRVHV